MAQKIAKIKKNGYETVLFSDLADAYRGKKQLPEKPVLITFDDGYMNNYTEAFPVMRETGSKCNIFLVYDSLGKHNAWHNPEREAWQDMLRWDMVAEMRESGLVGFGSHTMNHPNLGKISLDDVAWEARESKKRLEEKLGEEMTAFAYPYGGGAFMPDVRKAVMGAGYLFDFSFRQGKTPWPWDREAMTIDRLFIRGRDNNWDLALQLSRGASRL